MVSSLLIISMSKIERDQPVITFINEPATEDNTPDSKMVDNVYSAVRIPAVAPGILQAVLQRRGYDNVTTVDRRFNPGRKFTAADWERLCNSDFVGATSMINNEDVTLNLFDKLKEVNPNLVTAAGGFGPGYKPEKWLKRQTDFVSRREGFDLIVELLSALKNNEGYGNIKGLSHKTDGTIMHNEDRPLLTEAELATIPIPVFPENIAKNCTTYPILGSFGCFGDCKPCEVIDFYGRKWRMLPDEYLLQQIRNAPKGKKLFAPDDNWAPLKRREDVHRRMDKIIAGKFHRDWLLQLDAKTLALDPEFIKKGIKMGLIAAFVGFENFDRDVLREMHKPATADHNIQAAEICAENIIYVHGMVILGSPKDTYEKMDLTTKALIDLDINSTQLFPAIPLPGSHLVREGKMVALPKANEDSSLWDGNYVVGRGTEDNNDITCSGQQAKILDKYKQFYFRDRTKYYLKLARRFPSHPIRVAKVALLTYGVGVYARRIIASTEKSQRSRDWMNYLEEVDRETARQKEEGLPKEGVVFEGGCTQIIRFPFKDKKT